MGRAPAPGMAMRAAWACRTVSSTATDASFSQLTYASGAVDAKTIDRGRAPTGTCATTELLRVSMTATRSSASEVTYTQRPSGLVAMPSGS